MSPLSQLLLSIGELVLGVICAYTLHADLRRIHPDYPISAERSLALLLIPGYNLWGIWSSWQVASAYLPRVSLGSRQLPSVATLMSIEYLIAAFSILMGILIALVVRDGTIAALVVTGALSAFLAQGTAMLRVHSANRALDVATGHDQYVSTQWR